MRLIKATAFINIVKAYVTLHTTHAQYEAKAWITNNTQYQPYDNFELAYCGSVGARGIVTATEWFCCCVAV